MWVGRARAICPLPRIHARLQRWLDPGGADRAGARSWGGKVSIQSLVARRTSPTSRRSEVAEPDHHARGRERICAYYCGGKLYASAGPSRTGVLRRTCPTMTFRWNPSAACRRGASGRENISSGKGAPSPWALARDALLLSVGSPGYFVALWCTWRVTGPGAEPRVWLGRRSQGSLPLLLILGHAGLRARSIGFAHAQARASVYTITNAGASSCASAWR